MGEEIVFSSFTPGNVCQAGSVIYEDTEHFSDLDILSSLCTWDFQANQLNSGKRKINESDFDFCYEEGSSFKKQRLSVDVGIRNTEDFQPPFPNDTSYQNLDLLLNEAMSDLPTAFLEQFNPEPENANDLPAPEIKNAVLCAEALEVNQKLQESIIACLKELDKLREENLLKQKRCQEKLRDLRPQKKKEPNLFGWFGMPYFKDRIPSSSKKTQEAYNKPGKKFEVIFCFKLFTLITLIILELNADAVIIRDHLHTKIMSFTVQRKISRIAREKLSEVVKNELQLLGDFSSLHYVDKIDWNHIAYETFSSNYTADELRHCWLHSLRPDLETGPILQQERQALITLLESSNMDIGVDWEVIAERLAAETGRKQRTAFHCFSFYQRRLNKSHRIFGWTEVLFFVFSET